MQSRESKGFMSFGKIKAIIYKKKSEQWAYGGVLRDAAPPAELHCNDCWFQIELHKGTNLSTKLSQMSIQQNEFPDLGFYLFEVQV